MYVEIIGVIVIFVALRALITRNRAERLLYLNVIGFGVSAIIALVINTPFALIVAAAFFICSTISANAIAYTLKRLDDEILLEWCKMEFFVSIIAIALMVIGAFGIIFLKKPLDKVIMFTILDAGFILVVVLFKYLDVALFAALVDPLSTLVFILAIVKIYEIRKKKLESGELND